MATLDAVRAGFAAAACKLPRGRGFGRTVRILNRAFLRYGASPIVETRLSDGHVMRLDLRSFTEIEAYYWREYDTVLLRELTAELDPGTTFLDVGANVGFYAVPIARFLARSGGGGRVIAVEPVPGNVRRLRENLELNGVTDRCQVCEVALAEKEGPAEIVLREDFENGAATGNASIVTNMTFDHDFRRDSIRTRRLDDLWAEVARPGERLGFAKLDVEGHEACCLAGGRSVLAEHRPVLQVEILRAALAARGQDPASVAAELPDGYRMHLRRAGRWRPAAGFDEIGKHEDVLFVPEER